MIKKLFSTPQEKISKDQYNLINYLWGFDCIKSKNELKKIFLDLDKNFSYVRYYLSQFKRFKQLVKLKYIDSKKI